MNEPCCTEENSEHEECKSGLTCVNYFCKDITKDSKSSRKTSGLRGCNPGSFTKVCGQNIGLISGHQYQCQRNPDSTTYWQDIGESEACKVSTITPSQPSSGAGCASPANEIPQQNNQQCSYTNLDYFLIDAYYQNYYIPLALRKNNNQISFSYEGNSAIELPATANLVANVNQELVKSDNQNCFYYKVHYHQDAIAKNYFVDGKKDASGKCTYTLPDTSNKNFPPQTEICQDDPGNALRCASNYNEFICNFFSPSVDQDFGVLVENCGNSYNVAVDNNQEIYEECLARHPQENVCQEKCKEFGKQKIAVKYPNIAQTNLEQIQGECMKSLGITKKEPLGEFDNRGFTLKEIPTAEQKEIYSQIPKEFWLKDEQWGWYDAGLFGGVSQTYTYKDNKAWFSIREYDAKDEADNYCDKNSKEDYDCVCSAPLKCPDNDKDGSPNSKGVLVACTSLMGEESTGEVIFDCDDNNEKVSPKNKESYIPGAKEDVCADKLDNDCDGAKDCEENDCQESSNCFCNLFSFTPPDSSKKIQFARYEGLSYEIEKSVSVALAGKFGAKAHSSISRGIIIQDKVPKPEEPVEQIRISVDYIGSVSDKNFVPDGSKPARNVLDEKLSGFVSRTDIDEILNIIEKNFKAENEIIIFTYSDKMIFQIKNKKSGNFVAAKTYSTGSSSSDKNLNIKNIKDYLKNKPVLDSQTKTNTLLTSLTTKDRVDNKGVKQSIGFDFLKVSILGRDYSTYEDIKKNVYEEYILKIFEDVDGKLERAAQKYNSKCK
nr:hypothetical protein [uncultured archaeon]AQS31864.1 hypothetical protein [uncultured archaeon]